jgi:hypothetical protein
MSDTQQELASLLSKIEQLEERQNITAKYAVVVKRQLEEMTKKFNNLQQRFEQQSSLRNGLNGANSTDGLVLSEVTSVASVIDGGERIIPNNLINLTGVMLTPPVVAEVNADADKSDLAEVNVNPDVIETNLAVEIATAQQEEFSKAFSDEEFKVERIVWLFNRIQAAEKQSLETPIDAQEFWRRYKEGKRDFTGMNLAGMNLAGINLSGNPWQIESST